MTTAGILPAVAAPPARPRPVRVGGRTKGWRPHHPKAWSFFLTALLVVPLWALFAPPALGGWSSFTTVSGTSMLPNFHSGDLVLLRQESSYHVGEVVGYHNSQLHAVVMHRIVAIRNGHYFFKGDNNDFVDPFHPTKNQLVGAEWIHLAGAGRYVQYVRMPVVAAVLAAALWILSFRSRPASRRRRRRHRHAQ